MKKITIILDIDRAKEINFKLTDILCWVQGFAAACPDNLDRHPMGVSGIRSIRDDLTRAISDAEKEEPK